MGSVADKIARKMLKARRSKVVDLTVWQMALEAGFDNEGQGFGENFAELDPCHAIYVMGQNVVSVTTESISLMREAKGFVRIVGDAEDE